MTNATRPRRRLMTKNLIMMLVLLVVILIAVFAWYTDQYAATAEMTSISASAADNVELAVPEKVNNVDSFPKSNDSWKSEIEFKTSGYLKDLVKDVTSNGEQFVIPNFEAAKGLGEGRKVITDDVWVEGLPSKEALTNDKVNDDDQYNYVSLDFYVRSKSKNINVTADSFLAAGSELGYDGTDINSDNAKLLKGTNIYRCSSYGAAEGQSDAFSADAIVGALRVSLIGAPVDGISTDGSTGITSETAFDGGTWANNSALKFVWLPRPDLFLQTDDNSNNWKLFTGIKPSGNSAQNGKTAAQMNAIAEKTYCHNFYTGNVITGGVKKGLTAGAYCDPAVKSIAGATDNSGIFKVSKTNNDTQLGQKGHYPTLGQSANVASDAPETSKAIQFTAGTEQGDNRETTGYYVYKFTLNLWAEGEDAEARRSMSSGAFSLELDFGT